MSCSRTQHSEAGEVRTRGTSVLCQALSVTTEPLRSHNSDRKCGFDCLTLCRMKMLLNDSKIKSYAVGKELNCPNI